MPYGFSLNERYDQAMNNLGNLLKDVGEVEEAEKWLQTAVDVRYAATLLYCVALFKKN